MADRTGFAAAHVENASEHPIARAIVDGARERGVRPEDVSDFRSIGARGVTGKVRHQAVLIGNRRLLEEEGITGLVALDESLAELESKGRTAVIVATDGIALGIVAVADTAKEESVDAMRLSRATFRKIVENLIWASGYNVAAIPIAAMGLLHPMIGVVAMTLSSLSVIGNSILLRRVRLAP